MIERNIQGSKIMEVILNLGALRNIETNAVKNLINSSHSARYWVNPATIIPATGKSHIDWFTGQSARTWDPLQRQQLAFDSCSEEWFSGIDGSTKLSTFRLR